MNNFQNQTFGYQDNNVGSPVMQPRFEKLDVGNPIEMRDLTVVTLGNHEQADAFRFAKHMSPLEWSKEKHSPPFKKTKEPIYGPFFKRIGGYIVICEKMQGRVEIKPGMVFEVRWSETMKGPMIVSLWSKDAHGRWRNRGMTPRGVKAWVESGQLKDKKILTYQDFVNVLTHHFGGRIVIPDENDLLLEFGMTKTQFGGVLGLCKYKLIMGNTDGVLKTNTYCMNKKNKADGLRLLADIRDESIKTVFFDPQYRGLLDNLKYGNEGERQKERCSLPQMDEDTIIQFINNIDRVLVKSGHLFLWVDKYHLCEGVKDWFGQTHLKQVDMIVWNKGKFGMGCRSRYQSEFLIVFQKLPIRARGCWTDHSIPDVWEERVTKVHPHSKPIQLQRKLIEATSNAGDVILDPAAGGYSVLEACRLSGRQFIGGDIKYG